VATNHAVRVVAIARSDRSSLAPLAKLITTGVDLEGSVVGRNFTQSGQVHGSHAGDSSVLPVPEPSSWMMMPAG
jgi:hypothetical protein